MDEYKFSEEEFEDLFGNTPFENIRNIGKYINENYIPKSKLQELRDIDNIDLIQYKIKEFLED